MAASDASHTINGASTYYAYLHLKYALCNLILLAKKWIPPYIQTVFNDGRYSILAYTHLDLPILTID